MANMTSVVADMASRYGKPVILAETAYPFTTEDADSEGNVITAATPCAGYPATETGQSDNLSDVLEAAQAGGAIGVFYWEPTWIFTPGNGWDPADPKSGDGWDNQALFNAQGVANPALAVFKRYSR
jgi:arabinogalactan endo-1,4-beta-galactosidase